MNRTIEFKDVYGKPIRGSFLYLMILNSDTAIDPLRIHISGNLKTRGLIRRQNLSYLIDKIRGELKAYLREDLCEYKDKVLLESSVCIKFDMFPVFLPMKNLKTAFLKLESSLLGLARYIDKYSVDERILKQLEEIGFEYETEEETKTGDSSDT